LSSALIESAAQRRDVHGQVAFLDRRARPNGRHNFVFRHQLPLPLGQKGKDTERTGPERDGLGHTGPIQPRQTAAGAIEAKLFEMQNVRRTEPVHVLLPANVRALSNEQFHTSVDLLCEAHTPPKFFSGVPPTDRAPAQLGPFNRIRGRRFGNFNRILEDFGTAT